MDSHQVASGKRAYRPSPGMHPERAKAEAAYQSALKVWRLATCQANDEVFNAADEALKAARLAVVGMELKYPTKAEQRKQVNESRLRNRGLD
jgi:hypothetical protein